MIIDFLSEALDDLDCIYDWIAADRPGVASAKARLIKDKCRLLAQRPYAGRPGKEPGTRELSVNRWIIVYRVIQPKNADDEGIVQIISIWDSRQNR